ncbi:MAG: DUF5711 family protein [Clostridia bacterium]|nr:DUF5711 family protein [Clostridia bacterium]
MKEKLSAKKTGFIIMLCIIAAAVTAAIGIGTLLAVRLTDKPSAVSEMTTEAKADREGIESVEDTDEVITRHGFPYNARDGYIRNISASGKNVAVLEDGCLSLVGVNGNILFSAVHSYSSPMMKCAGDRILLYDKASGYYRVFDNKGEYINGFVEEGHIVTGDICKTGKFCLVTSTNTSSSYLTVFDENGKKKEYKWKCSPEHIIGTAISPDGKSYAAAVISAENGSAVSKVYFLNNKISQTPEPYILDSGAIVQIKFVSSKLLSVITDNNRVILNTKGEIQGYSSSAEFNRLKKVDSDTSGNSAALTTGLKSLDSQNIVVLDKKNAEKYSAISVEGAKDIAVSQGRVYVLSDGLVSFYNSKGALTGDSLVNDRCDMVCAAGKVAYCASDTQLFRVIAE